MPKHYWIALIYLVIALAAIDGKEIAADVECHLPQGVVSKTY